MVREIIEYKNYFSSFMNELEEAVQKKIEYSLSILRSQERISTKFAKLIKDGLYELRTEYKGNIYRVLLFSIKVK